MKIIISLAVFALALVACQSDKQKCEKEGKVWKAETETCISTEQAECEEKENMAWNEEENKCEEKSDAQAECEAQYKKWENNQCVDRLFTILFESKKENSDNLLEVNVVGKKVVSLVNPGECVKVATDGFKDLKISIDGIRLCDNEDDTKDSLPCSPGHHTIWYNSRTSGPQRPAIGYTLTKKDEAAAECTVKDTIE
ncbi:MAG: hypothetical protein OXM55_07725 [Bdellovibrionales bacterium]|nr:hypothetical protein [Bdellovibrionales bacterium]